MGHERVDEDPVIRCCRIDDASSVVFPTACSCAATLRLSNLRNCATNRGYVHRRRLGRDSTNMVMLRGLEARSAAGVDATELRKIYDLVPITVAFVSSEFYS